MHVKFIRCWYRECLRQRRPRINYWRNIIAFLDGKWIQLATYILRRLFVLSRYPPTEILNLDNNFLFVCLSVCLSFSLSPIKYEYHILYNILVQNSLFSFQFNLQYLHSHVNAQTDVDSMNVESGKLRRHVKKYRKQLRSVRFNVDKIKDDG